MKNELLIQYGSIRTTIQTNLETIGKLIQQAEELKKIVEKLNGSTDGTGETTVKESLKAQIDDIENTIASLIKQTGDLFDMYNKFVEQVFTHSSGK